MQRAQCVPKVKLLPTRVLDIGDYTITTKIHLYETTPGQCGQDVALSYCWGQSGNLTTTKGTLTQRKNGVPWEAMPKSFQDAIEITHGLKMRYLWIDALCIIQDDALDWQREAAKMAEVYENVSLTIATDAAQDPMRGILTPRHFEMVSTMDSMNNVSSKRHTSRNAAVETFSVDNGLGTVDTIYAREPLRHSDIVLPRSHYDITYPLMTRAWTLQERLLSRRILHVTASESIWECKTTLCCECSTIAQMLDYLLEGASPKIGFDKAMPDMIEECKTSLRMDTPQLDGEQQKPKIPMTTRAWTLLIGEYSNRMLTYESDRLPAILALAQRFSLNSDLPNMCTYLAGLWLEELPWLLCWRSFGRRFEKRPDVYCGPTWSWVSVITPVIWDTRIYDAVSKVEIIRTTTFPAGANSPFGQVKGAHAVVKGHVQNARICFDVAHDAVLGLRNERGERIFFVSDQSPSRSRLNETAQGNHGQRSSHTSVPCGPSLQQDSSSLSHGEYVVCLWVLHQSATDDVYGFVLVTLTKESIRRSVPECLSDDAMNTFERVGVITTTSRGYQKNEFPASSWFASAKIQTITIFKGLSIHYVMFT